MRIAILAKGPTLARFAGEYDEVWGLNQLAKTHDLDRLFVMDDLIYRMPAWDEDFPGWLRSYKRPIVTSKAYPEWPTSEEFPIVEAAKTFGLPLGMAFYSTVDYMLAYGILKGVDRIDMFGVDCSDRKREERVRVSIAMWIGVALSKGIRVTSQPGSFFQWYTVPGVAYEQGLYGYNGPPRIEALYGRSGEVPGSLDASGISGCV